MTVGEKGTAHQSVAGLTQRDRQAFTLIFTSRATLESPVNLTMSLDFGRVPVPRKNPHRHRRTCRVHTESIKGQGPSSCEATVITTIYYTMYSNIHSNNTDLLVQYNLAFTLVIELWI